MKLLKPTSIPILFMTFCLIQSCFEFVVATKKSEHGTKKGTKVWHFKFNGERMFSINSEGKIEGKNTAGESSRQPDLPVAPKVEKSGNEINNKQSILPDLNVVPKVEESEDDTNMMESVLSMSVKGKVEKPDLPVASKVGQIGNGTNNMMETILKMPIKGIDPQPNFPIASKVEKTVNETDKKESVLNMSMKGKEVMSSFPIAQKAEFAGNETNKRKSYLAVSNSKRKTIRLTNKDSDQLAQQLAQQLTEQPKKESKSIKGKQPNAKAKATDREVLPKGQ